MFFDEVNQGKSDEELFLAAFRGGYDDDEPWAAVLELRLRNTEAVFERAAAYCRSEVPMERARALNVLGLPTGDDLEPQPPHLKNVSQLPSVTCPMKILWL